jgi:Prenyltransferase and squalene oxidase repeat
LHPVDPHRLHDTLVRELRGLRRPDEGFSSSVEGPSEVEPTVVAALALRDARARAWLAARQRRDGGFAGPDGRIEGPTSGALAALVLDDADAASRALRFAIARRGLPQPGEPDQKRRRGWGWTPDARSLVEPTSRVLLAVNALTPRDVRTRREAVRFLDDHQCTDGGWNYGNASHVDVDLRGYAQTTAIALIALQGEKGASVTRAVGFLRQTWRLEPGGLTAAQALVAFRLHGVDGERRAATDSLGAIAGRRSFLERPLAVAWAALATGPDPVLEPLRSRA